MLSQTVKYFFIILGVVCFSYTMWTNSFKSKNWCQNKPSGVVIQTYHSDVYYDRPVPYYYQETCYKKTVKDVVNFLEDTLQTIVRLECSHDTTCFHHFQKILVK